MTETTATLFAFCGMVLLVSLFLAFVVLWGKRAERRAPKSETSKEEAAPIPPAPPAPSIADRVGAHIMSRTSALATPKEPTGNPVAADVRVGVQGFANGRNPDNDGLTAQPLAQPSVPEEARDIIIFWERVSQVERIVAGGKIGQVEAIELIFQCKRNGRADSVYGRARAAIAARSESSYRANQARLVELVAAGEEE